MKVLVLLSLLAATTDALPVCTRTWRGREHLHPKVHTLPALTSEQAVELSTFPAALDWCEQGFCTPSWNQHIPQYCGSCFAHGALSAAQDRIKILHARQGYRGPDVQLSRQTFLNCGPAHGLSGGCGGGEPEDVFEFMHHYGLPDETCQPYSASDNSKFTGTNGTCPPEAYCMNCITVPGDEGPSCFPVKKVVRYRAREFGRISGEHAIMKELLNGPVTCGIACSPEFTYDYSAGVFEDKTGFLDIDHDVEIVGWGEEDGVKYWNVRNSWGTYWGMQGFFKIVRGTNNLGIESDCHFVHPDISDEQLVFSETPIYGGSHWGIVPFADVAAADAHPVQSTDDVTLSNLPLEKEEEAIDLPDALDVPNGEIDEAAAKLPRTPSTELDLNARLPRTPSTELDLNARLPRTPSTELDLNARLPRTPSTEIDLNARLPRTPSVEFSAVGLPRTPSAELDLAKLPRTPSAELDLAKLPRTPSAELDLAKLPRTPSTELDLNAKLPRTPSAELDLNAKLPRTPSAELDLAKLPRTPSAELDLNAKLPRTPSAELDLAQLPRTPSAELDLASLPRTPSAEIDLNAKLPRTPSAEVDLNAKLPRTPSTEIDLNAKLPRTPSVELDAQPSLDSVLSLSEQIGSAHWLIALFVGFTAFGAAVGFVVARVTRGHQYQAIP